jgi:ABC-2 type transport system permease protein
MTADAIGQEAASPSLPSPASAGGLRWRSPASGRGLRRGHWIGGLYAIWLREVKRAMRDRGQLIGGVVRPLLYVLIMGIGLNPYFRGEIYGEVRFVVPYTYVQFLFPAVIALNIMYTSVQSAVSVIWDREFGFLREVLVSPMPRTAILLGKILGGTTVAMFHGALVLALARFADLSITLGDIALGLALMFLIAFALTSLGVVIANRIRSFEGFGVFSNVVILPLYFLSSSIFPLDPSLTSAQTRVIYPEWLVTLVELNPLTYAIDALRGAFIHFHQFDARLGPAVLLAMAVIFFLIALRDFRRA